MHNGNAPCEHTSINIDKACIAWKVDFNLALPSYDVDLKAVRNLIELSLGSPFIVPPRIQFISSIGVFRSKPSDVFPALSYY